MTTNFIDLSTKLTKTDYPIKLKGYVIKRRTSSEGDILRYTEGKTLTNGMIIPVMCVRYNYVQNNTSSGNSGSTSSMEDINIDSDFHGWKNKKIKIRKRMDVTSPTSYISYQYVFYYLEKEDSV